MTEELILRFLLACAEVEYGVHEMMLKSTLDDFVPEELKTIKEREDYINLLMTKSREYVNERI